MMSMMESVLKQATAQGWNSNPVIHQHCLQSATISTLQENNRNSFDDEMGLIGADDSPSSSDSGSRKGSSRPNRDPMSHRIIEKRRRDRMNNCLTNLSKLIPSSYLKKGRGRIEKTEIIEMAIRYMKYMQEDRKQVSGPGVNTHQDKAVLTEPTDPDHPDTKEQTALLNERYKEGIFDCISATLRFLALADGLIINDTMKTQLLFHVKESFGQFTKDMPVSTFSELLQVSKTRPSSSIMDNTPSSTINDDQPLNMSVKKPKLEESISNGCSQLREILSEAKDGTLPKRPHVFRYQPGFIQNVEPSPSGLRVAPAPLAHVASDPGPMILQHLVQNSAASSGSSTQYPSSPGSSRSVGSSLADSPPRVLSPPSAVRPEVPHVGVPIFALHPSGIYYIPSTVSSANLDPAFLQQLSATANASACHPVTIPVSFCPQQPTNVGSIGRAETAPLVAAPFEQMASGQVPTERSNRN